MTRAIQEETREKEIAFLQEAFERFSQETIQLEGAYSRLKGQFEQVNLQLAETNKRLNRKVDELGSIMANMTQGLIFLQWNGTIVTYNRRAEQILEKEQSAVTGHLFSDHFDDALFGFPLSNLLDSRSAPTIDRTSIQLPSGKAKTVELSLSIIEESGLLLLIRDVTELTQLQRLAIRKDRMHELGEMAASVAHEIRNPLGGIEGFAALLTRDLEDRPESQEMAKAIISGVQTLNHLVTNILHYARPVELQLESVPLIPLIQEVCSAIKVDKHLNQQVVLHQRLPNPSPVLPIDPLLFKGAILNLLVNAYQAIDGEGSVSVEVKKNQKDTIRILVRDTGSGIAPENLEKIFSPFFTTKQEGNGFGLSEVHRVVQLHGGQIDVQSEQQTGTTVMITLPNYNGEEQWR